MRGASRRCARTQCSLCQFLHAFRACKLAPLLTQIAKLYRIVRPPPHMHLSNLSNILRSKRCPGRHSRQPKSLLTPRPLCIVLHSPASLHFPCFASSPVSRPSLRSSPCSSPILLAPSSASPHHSYPVLSPPLPPYPPSNLKPLPAPIPPSNSDPSIFHFIRTFRLFKPSIFVAILSFFPLSRPCNFQFPLYLLHPQNLFQLSVYFRLSSSIQPRLPFLSVLF